MTTETTFTLELTESEAQYLVDLFAEDGHDLFAEDLNPLMLPLLRKLGDVRDWPSAADSD